MSDYNLQIPWSGKDSLNDTDPDKVVSGDDFNTEFLAVKIAINSKADLAGSASQAFSATTANTGTNTTQVATTAFVQAATPTAAVINALVYPVGSIYMNAAVATNPATLLGFGTWAAYGAGRVPVGKAASGTFDTLNETMGSETQTLSIANLPAHSHTFVAPKNSGAQNGPLSLDDSFPNQTSNTSSVGSGTAHNNIQPSIVVYMWKRTG